MFNNFNNRLVRNLTLLIIFLLLFAAAFAQNKNYWQQHVDYNITVQLDDILNTMDGYEQIVYTNNSPDTLHFICFHLWPNAYKNDKTAFSEQMLRLGRTEFYYSNEENRGYISNLTFKVNNLKADTEHHQQYIDVIKVKLPSPLAPGEKDTITTPFHEKIPFNFSRGGHVGQSYQITQWYPKPAVYDSKGWHPFPYLDQGEYYSEFGNYTVSISLPDNYIVAASGELQDTTELNKLLKIASTKTIQQKNYQYFKERIEPLKNIPETKKQVLAPKSSPSIKTLHYKLNNAHDFAWFASKLFIVHHDTVQLQQKLIDVFSYYPPANALAWRNAIKFAKSGLHYYDKNVGSYPYNIATVVSGPQAVSSGGMEYPTITLITTQKGDKELDQTIAHELGHNWFYGALASNERDHAWMDEGMNSYFERQYIYTKYPKNAGNKLSTDLLERYIIKNLENIHKDQPIDITSDSFTSSNYGLFVYTKTALWMNKLKHQLGNSLYDTAMKNYYIQWQFKHPYPDDFKQSIVNTTGKNIDTLYQQLFTTAVQRKTPTTTYRPFKVGFGYYHLDNTIKYRYISVAPMFGYNAYDKFMVGALIHNYQLPLNKFNFVALPLYSGTTNRWNYYARGSYRFILNRGLFENININGSVSSFSYKHFNFIDSLFPYQFTVQYVKVDPAIRFNFRHPVTSSIKSYLQLKGFFFKEHDYNSSSVTLYNQVYDSSYITNTNRQLVQLKYRVENSRVLYPYNLDVTVEATQHLVKAGLTTNYFYNYGDLTNWGLDIRFFAGKFFHINQPNPFDDYNYYLTLTGPRGSEDYTYSNYFVGRGDFEGFNSQQLMERDGFFKVGTELQGQIGKTDRWLSALNLKSSIFKGIPIKAFADLGTYAEAWDETNTNSRFLYDAGVQISLFQSCLNVYFPLVYSKVYKDYYKSIFPTKSFGKSISFSIDIQKFRLNKLTQGIPL